MRITSSESKHNLGRPGKVLITSQGLKANVRPKKYKKVKYAIRNFSMKDLSKNIREFDKLPYKSYDSRRPKYEPTDSYFYLSRQIAKCMMRTDVLNLHVYPIGAKFIAMKQTPTSCVCSTDKRELKKFLVDKTLSQFSSTEEEESKGIIVDKCSTDEDE